MPNLVELLLKMEERGEDSLDLEGVGTLMYVRDGKIPYLLYIPEKLDDTERLVVEANNCENPDKEPFLGQATGTLKKNYSILHGRAPILIPLIPTAPNKPYYQQLASDMFYEREPKNIADDTDEMISDALDKIEEKRNVRLDEKVFMTGYSSSGVFAQRFALFHPERIDTLCVGGASGSMPIPSSKIEYPLGTGGLPDFDQEAYMKIKFRYYVGEYELVNEAHDRKDIIDGEIVEVPRPMHDMTYFPRSVNTVTGKKYRNMVGENYFDRVERLKNIYSELGLDIESTVIKGRAHRDMEIDGVRYQGLREKEDPIIDNAYKDSVRLLKESKMSI